MPSSFLRTIVVVDHDPSWAKRFDQLRTEHPHTLGTAGVPVVTIEHVRSTAVPGLAAKPIIDCDIVIDEVDVEAAPAILIGLGFTPLGERGIPQRWAFDEPDHLAGTNTNVIVAGSLAPKNHLAVRDILRADPRLQDEHGDLKKRVGATAKDLYEYGAGKNSMVQRILQAAGLSEQKRSSINSNQVPIRRGNTPDKTL